MAKYVLIESRGTFECGDTDFFYTVATDLAGAGHQVTLFLVQNGVLPARSGASNDALAQVASAGVQVLADDFSLRERGISSDRLIASVTPAPIESIVDGLAEGRKAVWH